MKTEIKVNVRKKYTLQIVLALLSVLGFVVSSVAYGADISIGAAAANVTNSMSNLAKLITAGSYVAGFGFSIGAILKFKAHKDNPTQIPVGTPIALIFIAAALIFLPAIFGMAEQTVFNATASTGTAKGVDTFS